MVPHENVVLRSVCVFRGFRVHPPRTRKGHKSLLLLCFRSFSFPSSVDHVRLRRLCIPPLCSVNDRSWLGFSPTLKPKAAETQPTLSRSLRSRGSFLRRASSSRTRHRQLRACAVGPWATRQVGVGAATGATWRGRERQGLATSGREGVGQPPQSKRPETSGACCTTPRRQYFSEHHMWKVRYMSL